jgi:hypothetical protein
MEGVALNMFAPYFYLTSTQTNTIQNEDRYYVKQDNMVCNAYQFIEYVTYWMF